MKKILLVLLLIPLAFAFGWQEISFISMGISLALLAIVFMAGMGFNINELQMVAKEELYQLIATGLLVCLLLASDGILNMISQNGFFGTQSPTGYAPTLQGSAMGHIDNEILDMSNMLNNVEGWDMEAGKEGSRSLSCSLLQIGYSVGTCGGFTGLNAPLSLAGGILGFALGELYAMKALLSITTGYALSVLLPIGILMRTMKATRGAGGLLIAVAVSLYILLPMGVLFNEIMSATFAEKAVANNYPQYVSGPTTGPEISCGDPGSTSRTNEDKAVEAYGVLETFIPSYVYSALIRGTLGPILALLLVAASIRVLSALGGAEIDVSAISRFI